MSEFIDITGNRYGKLTVINRAYTHTTKSGNKYIKWRCICDCGNETVVSGESLKNGNTRSCGCLQKETAARLKFKHGQTKSRLHGIWNHMKQRCGNTNNDSYKLYGGEGKTVYKPWCDDFQCFYNWAMENGYKDGLTIDRIDNSKGYTPDNCRWATRKVQANNTRRNRMIELFGKTQTMSQWCEEFNIKNTTVYDRLKRGYDIERAFTQQVQRHTPKKR